MAVRVLIVSEDTGFSHEVGDALEMDGHEVHQRDALDPGSEWAVITGSHLAILDTRCVPIHHVYRLLPSHHTVNATMLLVMSPHTGLDAVEEALESGADAFVTTPAHARELIAKSRALLRRHPQHFLGRVGRTMQVTHDLRLDFAGRRLIGSGRELKLSVREFRLLCYLIEHEGVVLSRDHLLASVWGQDFDGELREVDVYVRHLRQKLEPESRHPTYILTVWGAGYQYRRPKLEGKHG